MRQTEMDLGELEPDRSDLVLVLDGAERKEVVALIAEAIVAMLESVRRREEDDDAPIEP